MEDLKVFLVVPLLLCALVLVVWGYSNYTYSNKEKETIEYIQEKLDEGYTCYYKDEEVDIDFDKTNILGYTYTVDDESKSISFYDKEENKNSILTMRRMYMGGRWYYYWW